jgi:predicted transcriptional regulator/transcriptional regulator with XRE-family HTH domain
MVERVKLGAKIRTLRRRKGVTQKYLADALGVSPSYINLIEHNRRPVTAALLIKLAQHFTVDLHEFASDHDERLVDDLMEAFGDGLFDEHGLLPVDVGDFVEHSPSIARAVRTLYGALKASRLAGSPADGPLPSEEVSDLVQEHLNWFPDLEDSAARIVRDGKLDPTDVYGGLRRYLRDQLLIDVRIARVGEDPTALRRFDPERRQLVLSETLPPRARNFQLAHVAGLVTCGDSIDRIIRNAGLSTGDARRLAKVALANYVAGAVLMPYPLFLAAARDERYDLELLGHRFKTSLEQTCHRLTTLRKPGHEGIPFHMVRVDIAGNISKKFSATGIRFARFGAACSLWNVFQAFMTPGRFRTQLSVMPPDKKGQDPPAFFCIARTVPKGRGGYLSTHSVHAIGLGCSVERGREMVYSDGMDLTRMDGAVKIGVSCRLCPRTDCAVRAFPQLNTPLGVDPNIKRVSTFSPVEPTTE